MERTERARLIAMYGMGPSLLRDSWARVPPEARTWRPEPGEWSAHEIVVHCADSETYAAIRIRLLVAEPDPLIVGYDQEQWARLFDYPSVPVESSFALIESVRSHTSLLIGQLGDDDWSKTGTHTLTGPFSAEDWLVSYGNHLHDHARQIQSNIDLWYAREP